MDRIGDKAMDTYTSEVFINGACFVVNESTTYLFARLDLMSEFEFIAVELVEGGTAYIKVGSIIAVAEV